MIKGSPDYIKRLVSIKGDRLAPFGAKCDLVKLSDTAQNAAEKKLVSKLVSGAKGVKSVKTR
jgi:hypothetical protein